MLTWACKRCPAPGVTLCYRLCCNRLQQKYPSVIVLTHGDLKGFLPRLLRLSKRYILDFELILTWLCVISYVKKWVLTWTLRRIPVKIHSAWVGTYRYPIVDMHVCCMSTLVPLYCTFEHNWCTHLGMPCVERRIKILARKFIPCNFFSSQGPCGELFPCNELPRNYCEYRQGSFLTIHSFVATPIYQDQQFPGRNCQGVLFLARTSREHFLCKELLIVL